MALLKGAGQFNPIIGYNNSGKSNVLRAINWLLRKSVLTEHAFHNAELPVTVEGLISNVDLTLLPENQRASLGRYLDNGRLRFRRRQDTPVTTAAQIRVDVFDGGAGEWVVNPTGLDNAIGVLFPEPLYIEAMDDAAVDVGRFAARNTIGLLLKFCVDQIRANNAQALQAVVSDINALSGHLSGGGRIRELNTLEADATSAVADFFPGLSLHLNIEPPSLEDLVKSATISLSDDAGGSRPFASFGHGAQRSVQMALIKLLASQIHQQRANGATTVLLIDEPELYLHPQAIEVLRESLKALSAQNFQVIFSTHSPLLIGNDVLSTSVVYKAQPEGSVVRNKLSTAAQAIAQHPHQAQVIFALQHATYLMFSEKVLIVEGKTEMMVIPPMYKVVSRRTLGQGRVCLIEASGSGSVAPMIRVLREVGFAPKAVVDLDYMFKTAPQSGFISDQDPDFVSCRDWFVANAVANNFTLGTDNFPAKRDVQGNLCVVTPEHAFAMLAQARSVEIARLAQQLRGHNIWVWEMGAIEAHLGLVAKNDARRLAFISMMEMNANLDHSADAQNLTNFINWI
ncbi:ATP-dependent nuclease [Pandoraea morbifera]|nr:ATP-binding protein [Pandoraea morbifera]